MLTEPVREGETRGPSLPRWSVPSPMLTWQRPERVPSQLLPLSSSSSHRLPGAALLPAEVPVGRPEGQVTAPLEEEPGGDRALTARSGDAQGWAMLSSDHTTVVSEFSTDPPFF